MHARPTTVEGVIAALPEPRRGELKALDRLIRAAVPKLAPHIRGKMLGYGPYHYRYASGREGDWSLICVASRKEYISLYVCAVDKRGTYLAEGYRGKLPNADIGKSCLRFKRLADLDPKALTALLKAAEKLGGAGEVGR